MASENPRLTLVSSDFQSMIMSNGGNSARCSAAGAFVRSRKLPKERKPEPTLNGAAFRELDAKPDKEQRERRAAWLSIRSRARASAGQGRPPSRGAKMRSTWSTTTTRAGTGAGGRSTSGADSAPEWEEQLPAACALQSRRDQHELHLPERSRARGAAGRLQLGRAR